MCMLWLDQSSGDCSPAELARFRDSEGGRLREAEIRDLLGSGRWPARNIDQNIADLAAQVAACARGAEGLLALCADYGPEAVTAYMGHVQDHAEAVVRRLIPRLARAEPPASP